MNRRNFLGILGKSLVSLPFISLAMKSKNVDAENTPQDPTITNSVNNLINDIPHLLKKGELTIITGHDTKNFLIDLHKNFTDTDLNSEFVTIYDYQKSALLQLKSIVNYHPIMLYNDECTNWNTENIYSLNGNRVLCNGRLMKLIRDITYKTGQIAIYANNKYNPSLLAGHLADNIYSLKEDGSYKILKHRRII
jgi:hypothetical protein